MNTKRQSSYDTNLASEFFVMSELHRLGLDAHLTLGNKKAVDIVVVHAPGDTITIDVKAVAGSVDWLVGSSVGEPQERHSRGQRRCPAGFGSPTSLTSFLRIGYRSILVLRGGCRSGVMERIEKAVYISYRHTNSPRALAARFFAYQQLHSSGVKLPPVGSLNAANVVSCVE